MASLEEPAAEGTIETLQFPADNVQVGPENETVPLLLHEI